MSKRLVLVIVEYPDCQEAVGDIPSTLLNVDKQIVSYKLLEEDNNRFFLEAVVKE